MLVADSDRWRDAGVDAHGVEGGVVKAGVPGVGVSGATGAAGEGELVRGDEEDCSDLIVTGCGPVCLSFTDKTLVFSASVFIVALQVFPRQRQVTAPLLTE